jgi:hypothetical protein
VSQQLYSRKFGEISVEIMWEDNGVRVAKVSFDNPVPVRTTYLRLSSPERVATREDLEKAISYLPHLAEALFCFDNPDLSQEEWDKVLEVRRKIIKSAAVKVAGF